MYHPLVSLRHSLIFLSVVISYEADEGHPSLKASSVGIRKVLIFRNLIERQVTERIEHIANHSLAIY